jgi:hypothetical protein
MRKSCKALLEVFSARIWVLWHPIKVLHRMNLSDDEILEAEDIPGRKSLCQSTEP